MANACEYYYAYVDGSYLYGRVRQEKVIDEYLLDKIVNGSPTTVIILVSTAVRAVQEGSLFHTYPDTLKFNRRIPQR